MWRSYAPMPALSCIPTGGGWGGGGSRVRLPTLHLHVPSRRTPERSAMPWTLDVEVESTPLSTTGGHTWAAARRLAAYLSAAADQLGLTRPGLQLLELGAGTGWLGCTVARNLHPTALVCLTEQAGGLDWLRHNVQLNRQRGLPLARVQVQACDWLEYAGSGDAQSATQGSVGGSSSAAESSEHGQNGLAAMQRPAACSNTDAQAQEQQPQQQNREQRHAGERPQQPGAGNACSPDAVGGQLSCSSAALDLRSTRWDFIIGSDLIYNEVRGFGSPAHGCMAGRPAGRHTSGGGGPGLAGEPHNVRQVHRLLPAKHPPRPWLLGGTAHRGTRLNQARPRAPCRGACRWGRAACRACWARWCAPAPSRCTATPSTASTCWTGSSLPSWRPAACSAKRWVRRVGAEAGPSMRRRQAGVLVSAGAWGGSVQGALLGR